VKLLERFVGRLRRPTADPRLAAARAAHAGGDFLEARRLAVPPVEHGATLHGLVNHGFLRRYAWTLDFDSMAMTFVPAA
jgi:hypothetical protein